MAKYSLLLFFNLCLFFNCQAQDTIFETTLSIDSLLMDNTITITFSLKNATGSAFEAPDFEGFQIVGGPNQSSSYSMMNGTVSQELSFSYILLPEDIGNYFIQPAYIEVDGKTLETAPLEIIVYPNPDGIQQTPKRPSSAFDLWSPRPPTTPKTPKKVKKKRKIYKM